MFIAAVAHYYVFSHTPFVDPNAPSYPCWASFTSMFDMSDVRQDMTDHVRVVGRSVKDTVLRTIPRKMDENERVRLLNTTPGTSPSINDVNGVSGPDTTEVKDVPYGTNPRVMNDWGGYFSPHGYIIQLKLKLLIRRIVWLPKSTYNWK